MRSRHPNPVGKVKSRVGLASRDYPQGEKRRVNNTNVCAYGKTCSNRSGTDIYRDGGLGILQRNANRRSAFCQDQRTNLFQS
ncbi:hypothetical protein C0Q70_06024 [Pomacea canaliculata]|uniref:Uncharacterized protein n=1 Tax=Pomacea canaliculata TaxID=400727 RepID=A0A2T7PN13_POMCA|nr:hypothetical protein C0Q70_06024 [Pomacea canaliculata]